MPRPFSPTLYPQKSSPESARRAISSSVANLPSTSATRVSPRKHLAYVDFPRHTTSTFLGTRKYSTVRASAKEFGGMMQESPRISTNDLSSKFLGSTMVLLMLVNSLNSFEQRIS